MNGKRIFLIIVYMALFIFSVYSIIQIRHIINGQYYDRVGKFVFLFMTSGEIDHRDFIIIKLSLFVFVAILSFILMLTNYFVFHNPDVEKEMISNIDRELKREMKK